jgi:uncharacterized coiled-coil protein SlyX
MPPPKSGVENLGTSTGAAAALEVKNDLGARGLFIHGSSGVNAATFAAFANRAALITDATEGLGIGIAARQVGGDIRFYTGGVADTNERMIIDSTGRVGIGTSTPTAQLEVAGTFANTIAGDVEIAHNLNFSNDTASYIRSLSHLYIEAGPPSGNSDLVLRSRGSGDVVIGNNTTYFRNNGSIHVMSSAARLTLEGTGTGGGSRAGVTLKGATGNTFDFTMQDDGYPRRLTLAYNNAAGSANMFTLTHEGNIGIGTTHPSGRLEIFAPQESNKIIQGGPSTTYTELAQRSWGGNAGILFSAYSPSTYVDGDLSATGNTKYKFGASSFGSSDHRAKAIVVGHQNINFLISDASSGAGNNVAWNSRLNINPNEVTIPAGNVGVGIVSPTQKLHVYTAGHNYVVSDAPYASNAVFSLYSAGVQRGAIYRAASTNDMRFYTHNGLAGGDRMTITGNGNVGIGTANPAFLTEIVGETAGSAITLLQLRNNATTDGTGTTLRFLSSTNPTAHHGGAEITALRTGNAGSMIFRTANSTPTMTERMRIDTSGNLGIGITNPNNILHIVDAATPTLQIERTGAATSALYLSAQDNYVSILGRVSTSSQTGRPIRFISGTTTAMTISTLGYVGIGTTAPSYRLQLSSNSAAKPTSNTWTIASDQRLKDNITSFSDGLGVIMNINPVNYVLNGLGGMPSGAKGIGVIAQDIQNIAPYTVSTFRAKLNPSDPHETDLLSFDSSALTFVLINAIKEQQGQISALNLSLNDQGDLDGIVLEAVTDGTYQVRNTLTNTVITRVTSLAEAVIARLRVGFLTADRADIKNLTVNNQTIEDLVAEEVNNALASYNQPGQSPSTTTPTTNTTQLEQQVTSLEEETTDQQVTLDHHDARLTDLEEQTATTSTRLTYLEERVTGLADPGSHEPILGDFDITPVESRLSLLESTIASLSALLASSDTSDFDDINYDELDLNLSLTATESAIVEELAGDPSATDTDSLESDLIITADMISADAIFVTDFLSVLGTTVTTNANITAQLKVGDDTSSLTLAGNSIQAGCADTNPDDLKPGCTLFLQPLGGSINLLAGLMILDAAGNVTINGNLTVTGRLTASAVDLESLTFANSDSAASIAMDEGNLTVNLASESAFRITDHASISASGSARFTELAADNLRINTDIATPSATPLGAAITTSASAGTTYIPTGYSQVVIHNPRVTPHSLVYITPISSTGNRDPVC